MTIVSAVQDYFGEFRRRRRFHRTERLIRSLPPEVLKDIGWPGNATGLDDPRSRRRFLLAR